MEHLSHEGSYTADDWELMWHGGSQGIILVMMCLFKLVPNAPEERWGMPEDSWFLFLYEVCWTLEQIRKTSVLSSLP